MITEQQQENLVSEVAEIQEVIPIDELEQYSKIKEIIKGLNECEAERLRQNSFTNKAFFNSDGTLTECYLWHSKEKKKYFYLDCGTSGAFMVDKSDGMIYNIKGYGKINKAKCRGNIQNIEVEQLHQRRHA